MAASSVNHRVRLGLSCPDAVTDLFEFHLKAILIHTIAEGAAHHPIQKPQVLAAGQCLRLIPPVLAGGDQRKGLIGGIRQFFGRKTDFEIDDGLLDRRRWRRRLQRVGRFGNVNASSGPGTRRTD